METDENIDTDNLVIKSEPADDAGYGVLSQEYSATTDYDTDDYMSMSKGYLKEEPDDYSDQSNIRFGACPEGPSGDANGYSVSMVSDTGEAGHVIREIGTSLEDLNPEDEDNFRIVSNGGDSADSETSQDDVHNHNGTAECASAYDKEAGLSGDECGTRTGIKEEKIDPEYDFAYTYTTNFMKEEAQSAEEDSMTDMDNTCTDQHNHSETNSLNNGEEETETEEFLRPRRTRRVRQKAKRRASFEYDDGDSKHEEFTVSVNSFSNGNVTVESDNFATAEPMVYMDTDREEFEEEEHAHFTQDSQSEEEGHGDNMIAQYAIFDPDKSAMVGIKSVNPKNCDICGKEFQYEFHKKFHMQQVHPEKLENDKRNSDYEIPLWKINPRSRYNKTCFICRNRVYTHPYFHSLHMQEVHPERLIDNKMIQNLTSNNKKICPVCNEGFDFAFQLKYHIQKEHAEVLVDDKRVDINKLPPGDESEFPNENDSTPIDSESVEPDVSASPSADVKLTYSVQDILNIKKNLEKEKAAKEAKEAQRLAKSLEPRKRPGRPPKPADSLIQHDSTTPTLKRGPGRPRKNLATPKGTTSVSESLYTETENPKSTDKSDKAGSESAVQEISHEVSEFLVKEKTVSHGEVKANESKDHGLDEMVGEEKLKDGDGQSMIGTDDSINILPDTDTMKKTSGSQEIQNSNNGGVDVSFSKSSTNVVHFDASKQMWDVNTRINIDLDLFTSSSSGFAVTSSFQEQSSEGNEKECIETVQGEHAALDTKPKRKRKKKVPIDLPHSSFQGQSSEGNEKECINTGEGELAALDTKPKRKRKKKELMDIPVPTKRIKKTEKKALKKLMSEDGKNTDKKTVKPKTPKAAGCTSKKKKLSKVLPVPQNVFCGNCGKIFAGQQAFKNHEEACNSEVVDGPGSPGYYPCKLCPMVFKHVAAHQLHRLRDHVDSSKTCPFCGKVFAYQSVMKKHMYIHTNVAVKKAITALKNQDDTQEDVAMEKDSKLIDLISNLDVPEEVKPDSLKIQDGALKLSVSLKPVPSSIDSLSSLPTVSSPHGMSETLNPIPKGEGMHNLQQQSVPSKMSETTQGKPDSGNASTGTAKKRITFESLMQALSNRAKSKLSSSVPSTVSSSSSDLSSPPTSVSSVSLPPAVTSLVKNASTSAVHVPDKSDVDSTITSLASKLPFPLCPAITSLLQSPSPSSGVSSADQISRSSVRTASTATSPMMVSSLLTSLPLPTQSMETPSPSHTSSALFASKISSSIACLKTVIPPVVSPTTCIASRSKNFTLVPAPPPAESPRQERPRRKTYPCKVCNEEFPNIAFLYKHELSQHLKHICPHCNKGFAYEGVLRKHLTIHEDNTARFTCIWCGKVCTTLKELKNHLVNHNGSCHQLNCNKCAEAWYDVNGRLPGVLKDQIGEHLQDCFNDPVEVDEILETYMTHGDKNETQSCLDCDKCYILKNDHSRNVMISHIYRCKVCDKVFTEPEPTLFKEHIFLHHTEAKGLVGGYKKNRSFNCGACSEKFTLLFNFMCHMTTHKKAFRAQQLTNVPSLTNLETDSKQSDDINFLLPE